MVSVEQLTALIDCLEAKPELALGRFNRTKEGRSLAKRMWVEVSHLLNSVSADCITKSADGWRLYYNEYKCKLLKKVKMERREMIATDGGRPKKNYMTPLQKRLYNILGHDVGEPLPGVRHNPLIRNLLTDKNENENYDNQNDISTIIFADARNSQDSETKPIFISEPPKVEVTIIDTSDIEITQPSPSPTTQPPSSPTTQPSPSPTIQPPSSPTTQPSPSPTTQPPSSPTTQPSTSHTNQPNQRPRRRRQRNREASALETAQVQLEKAEKLHADATMSYAQSTNRLAAALENIANQISKPLVVIIKKSSSPHCPKKRFCRIIYSSDSE